MIYVDVTGACQSALNTGTKRMQRGLHSFLSRHVGSQPIVWQSMLGAYRVPTPGDLAKLETPFSFKLRGIALYDELPGWPADVIKCFQHYPLCLDWPNQLQEKDVLLFPDKLWDNRGRFLKHKTRKGGIRVGFFHDAIALKNPNHSKIDYNLCRNAMATLTRFDLVVCISCEAERDLHFYWQSYGLSPTPTLVIPWPVPFTQKRPDHRPSVNRHEALYVSRLDSYKNHHRLLDACEQIWSEGLPLKLRLIGCKAYPVATAKILARISGLQNAGYDLVWKAHVSDEELHEAYRSCSFTVFPSLMEGFGLPIIESLWNGRPVICADSGAIAEVASGGGCVMAQMNDTREITSALRRMLTDDSHYSALRSEIEKRDFLTWEGYWQKLSAGLESIR